jgi:hypothetical protein
MRKIMVYKFLAFLFYISHEMRRHEGFRSADNSYYVITNIRWRNLVNQLQNFPGK